MAKFLNFTSRSYVQTPTLTFRNTFAPLKIRLGYKTSARENVSTLVPTQLNGRLNVNKKRQSTKGVAQIFIQVSQ